MTGFGDTPLLATQTQPTVMFSAPPPAQTRKSLYSAASLLRSVIALEEDVVLEHPPYTNQYQSHYLVDSTEMGIRFVTTKNIYT